jgi:hypothetical protein
MCASWGLMEKMNTTRTTRSNFVWNIPCGDNIAKWWCEEFYYKLGNRAQPLYGDMKKWAVMNIYS